MRLAIRSGIALAGMVIGVIILAAVQAPNIPQSALAFSSEPISSKTVYPTPQRDSLQQSPSSDQGTTEVVATLATGRVYILIAKSGIIVGVAGTPVESGSLPPRIVQLADRKLGVLMGAVEWKDPDSGRQIASFADELSRLHPLSGAAPPQLNREATGGVAADIEGMGLGVFERLRTLAEMLHEPLQGGTGQSVLQIILADYVEDYGPEIWTLDYSFAQGEMRTGSGYLETHANRPRYTQLWPPEKGQPHSLLALGYPTAQGGAGGEAELMRGADAAHGQPAVAEVKQAILAGDTRKVDANDAVAFMRATLTSSGEPGNFAIAAIGEKTGFAWVVKQSLPAGSQKQRPPGAPTLTKP